MAGRKLAVSATWLAAALLFVSLLAGCGSSTGGDGISTEYGVRRSSRGSGSVNGTGVLADMFEQRGHTVKTWHRLSPRIRSNQVIVWAPDSFTPPNEEVIRFLEGWLAEDDGRTLVYIGRDYDAAITYWESVLPGAPPEQARAIETRLAFSRQALAQRRSEETDEAERWFTVDSTGARRQPKQLTGPWATELLQKNVGFDPSKADIEIHTQLRTPGSALDPSELKYTTLLESGSDVLVSSVKFGDDYEPLPAPPEEDGEKAEESEPYVSDGGDDEDYGLDYSYGSGYGAPSDSRIIVVSNGSFLLNLPLVNDQHRLLAGKLIDECETQNWLNVAFLESGPSGVPVYDQEPKPHSYVELLRTWPMNVILLHALGLGLLFCFVFFPIFGRPVDRSLKRMEKGVPIYVSIGSESSGASDFGKHVEALGEMMERTQESQYAQARLQYYQQHVKRDSGVSHR